MITSSAYSGWDIVRGRPVRAARTSSSSSAPRSTSSGTRPGSSPAADDRASWSPIRRAAYDNAMAMRGQGTASSSTTPAEVPLVDRLTPEALARCKAKGQDPALFAEVVNRSPHDRARYFVAAPAEGATEEPVCWKCGAVVPVLDPPVKFCAQCGAENPASPGPDGATPDVKPGALSASRLTPAALAHCKRNNLNPEIYAEIAARLPSSRATHFITDQKDITQ
jgi:ribosomal protein L40E